MDDATVALSAGPNSTRKSMDDALAESSDIPYATQWYRANGRPSIEDKAKRQQYLTPSEEELLVECLVQMSHEGFTVPKKHLRSIAHSIARRRSTKFRTSATKNTGLAPGANWYLGLFKRHPRLEASMATRRDGNRLDKNIQGDIQRCFEGIKAKLDREDVLPEKLYNMEEKGANRIGTRKSKYGPAFTLPLRAHQKVLLPKGPSAPTSGIAETVPSQSSSTFANGKHNRTTHTYPEIQQGLLEAPTPTNPLAEVVSSRLSDFFTNGSQRQTAYTDSEIQHISLLLSRVSLQWSKVPRTYMILRIISCLDLLDSFIDLGISDHWFPFTERSLPPCLRPGKRLQFVGAQNLVMTKSMDLEKGESGQHCYFRQGEPLPLEMKGILGSGSFGQVDRVLSTISFREYALKRVSRSGVFRGRTKENIQQRAECVKQFIAEIGTLKRLKHRHVVEFVGSYTDPKYMGLIMSPIADMDLSAYLAGADKARYKELRTFFGCLARALAFLHEQSIRHKDIKPSNILVHSGNVLFTDFGLAFDFTDKTGSTTAGIVNGRTLRYCAPEVANEESRNTSSDIWSLGIVFLEMTAVLKGRTVAYMYDFLKEHGSGLAFVRLNPAGTDALVAELREVGSSTDNAALGWVQDMVMLPQQLRPTALSLMSSITSAGQEGYRNEAFYGICCAPLDNFLSDSDELEIANTR